MATTQCTSEGARERELPTLLPRMSCNGTHAPNEPVAADLATEPGRQFDLVATQPAGARISDDNKIYATATSIQNPVCLADKTERT